jgi:hypothetical protein
MLISSSLSVNVRSDPGSRTIKYGMGCGLYRPEKTAYCLPLEAYRDAYRLPLEAYGVKPSTTHGEGSPSIGSKRISDRASVKSASGPHSSSLQLHVFITKTPRAPSPPGRFSLLHPKKGLLGVLGALVLRTFKHEFHFFVDSAWPIVLVCGIPVSLEQ